jgi:hypothetical protein
MAEDACTLHPDSFKTVLETSIAPEGAVRATSIRVDPVDLGERLRAHVSRTTKSAGENSTNDDDAMSYVWDHVGSRVAELREQYDGRGLLEDLTAQDVLNATRRCVWRRGDNA